MTQTNSGALMAIDHGLKRLGIAVSDRLWLTARELTIIRRTTRQEDFIKLQRLAEEQHAVAWIIGLPYSEGAAPDSHTQADTVRLWAERFATVTPLPILLWDEQLSSADARNLSAGRRRKPSDPIDDLAARVILQSYLDAHRDGLAPSPLPDAPL